MNASAIVVIELVLKGTAVLLMGCGAAVVLARSSAALRSLLWLGVFATLLLLPLALIVHPVWAVPVHGGSSSSVTPIPPRTGLVSEQNPVVEAAPPSHFFAGLRWSLPQWLFAAYGCGVAGVLVFRLIGCGQLWSLRRTAVADAELQYLVDRWRKTARLRRPVRVFTSSQVTVPMTWGTWRPVIVFPQDCHAWAPAELKAAMQHEFAHVRHGDAARRWLGTIVSALWWCHPLAWVSVRAWKLEQERACDDAVLNSGGEAAAYAQQLLVAAGGLRLSRFRSAAALIMAMPAGLEARLSSVMGKDVDRSPVRGRSLLGVGAMTLLALVGGIAIQAQSIGAAPGEPAGMTEAEALEKLAAETIIPKLEFKDAMAWEALDFIGKKVGFRIDYTPKPGEKDTTRLSVSLTNIPASEALKYVAGLSNAKVTYEARAVMVRWVPGPGEVRAPNTNITVYTAGSVVPNKAESAVMKAADKIIFPAVDFHEASITEILDFIRKKAVELDPEKRGVTINFKPGADTGARITMNLHDLPLSELLRFVAGLAKLELRVGPDAVTLEPAGK